MKNLNKLILLTATLIVVSCSSDDSPAPTEISSSSFTASLDENPAASQPLGTVNATSDGGDITFAIASQTPSGALSIDSVTGEISTADLSLYDYEVNPQITAMISLTADGVTETTTATISLNDISDIIYTHIATADTNRSNQTILDHPDLNGNPDANIVITHNWSPNGVYNTNVTGVWYDGSNWTIYNEDFNVNMIEDSAYNILISKDGGFTTHTVTNTTSNFSLHDDPITNNKPDLNPIITTYYNPNSIYNNNNISTFYGTNQQWGVWNESSGDALPLNASINILAYSDNATAFTHATTEDNVSGHITYLDNELLNDNPDAKFVMSPNGTVGGINAVYGIYYSPRLNRWAIFAEDFTAIPFNAGITFHIQIIE